MGALDDFTPAQIGQLDQEIAQTKSVLWHAVGVVRDLYLSDPMADPGEVFVSLVKQFAQLDVAKVLALFTQAVLELAAREGGE